MIGWFMISISELIVMLCDCEQLEISFWVKCV